MLSGSKKNKKRTCKMCVKSSVFDDDQEMAFRANNPCVDFFDVLEALEFGSMEFAPKAGREILCLLKNSGKHVVVEGTYDHPTQIHCWVDWQNRVFWDEDFEGWYRIAPDIDPSKLPPVTERTEYE